MVFLWKFLVDAAIFISRQKHGEIDFPLFWQRINPIFVNYQNIGSFPTKIDPHQTAVLITAQLAGKIENKNIDKVRSVAEPVILTS